SLCRTTREDIDASVDALRGAPRSRLHVFIATSRLHMERKLSLEPQEVLERIERSVRYARGLADEVEFSAEDATRSAPSFLADATAGACQVECTINGIGERAGNAALEEIVMALRTRAGAFHAETGVDPRCLHETSTLVSRLTGYAVQRNKAIVGANAFAHEA